MIRFESSTKINFISPALRAWGWGTLLIMQWASEVAYLSSYNEAETWQAFIDLALVPEHFRLMMANMVQLGSTDITTALREVKAAIQESAEYPSRWAELTPIDQAVLSMIVGGQKPYAQESRELIAERMEIAVKGVTSGVIQRSITRMCAKGVIATTGHREYLVEDRAFAAWVEQAVLHN